MAALAATEDPCVAAAAYFIAVQYNEPWKSSLCPSLSSELATSLGIAGLRRPIAGLKRIWTWVSPSLQKLEEDGEDRDLRGGHGRTGGLGRNRRQFQLTAPGFTFGSAPICFPISLASVLGWLNLSQYYFI